MLSSMTNTIFLKGGWRRGSSTACGFAGGTLSLIMTPSANFIGKAEIDGKAWVLPLVYMPTIQIAARETTGTKFHQPRSRNLMLGGAQNIAITGTKIMTVQISSVL